MQWQKQISIKIIFRLFGKDYKLNARSHLLLAWTGIALCWGRAVTPWHGEIWGAYTRCEMKSEVITAEKEGCLLATCCSGSFSHPVSDGWLCVCVCVCFARVNSCKWAVKGEDTKSACVLARVFIHLWCSWVYLTQKDRDEGAFVCVCGRVCFFESLINPSWFELSVTDR